MGKATTGQPDSCRALVIGGSGSLGFEICRELAAAGTRLAFTYHKREKRAKELVSTLAAAGSGAVPIQLDLEDHEATVRAVGEAGGALGGLDSLVVASGIATGQPWTGHQPGFFDITPEGLDKMIRVNARGIFFACREAARLMMANPGGRVVLVGSIDGIKPVPSPPDYALCKSALWGLTQSLAKELGRHSILVNLVAPGIMEGGIARLLSGDLMADYLKHSALRRVGTFAEVAKVIAFLAGPANTYLTGQAVVLDGGL